MKNGGDAFPCYVGNESAERGMTLRDYVAAQIFPELIMFAMGRNTVDEWRNVFPLVAKDSYLAADAFIAEKERNKGVE
ncbi:MAG: hypothetical protein LBQ89_07900 [Treponema sp.]|jgi:hypothetical protein|nr:hypothetical protein [Treponema sp.]